MHVCMHMCVCVCVCVCVSFSLTHTLSLSPLSSLSLQPGDEVKKIDDHYVEDYDLPAVTRLVVGPVGSKVTLNIARKHYDEDLDQVEGVGPSGLQCVAVCCSVVQSVAVCCSALQCVAMWCGV